MCFDRLIKMLKGNTCNDDDDYLWSKSPDAIRDKWRPHKSNTNKRNVQMVQKLLAMLLLRSTDR